MHIAFLNTLYPPYGPLGGAEATLRFLVRGLSARGHRCSVVTLTPDGASYEGRVDDAAVHYVPLANVYWPHGKRPQLLRPVFQMIDAYNPVMRKRLSRILRKLQPDVVHGHNLQGFSVSAWAAASDCRVPVVQTLHDYYVVCPRGTLWRPKRGNCVGACVECRYFSWPRRRMGHLPAMVTCVSHRMRELVTAEGMFRMTPTRVIRGNNPAGIGDAPSSPGDGTLRLGFLGRLDPVKGVDMLLHAVGGLPREAVHLVIGGGGDAAYEASLRGQAAVQPNVSFLGTVTPSSFLTQIDLLVVPSVWEDPLPRVVAEAFAYGTPSLVTPMGGLPEYIEHGVTGLVAPSAGAQGLRVVLEEVLAGRWDVRGMRPACLKAAEAYTPDLITSQYEAVLLAAARGIAPPEWAGEAARVLQ